MAGLREIFFKQPQSSNIIVTNFVNLEDLIIRTLQKQGKDPNDIKVLLDLCRKQNREDLIKKYELEGVYGEYLDATLENSCQKMSLSRTTYDA